MKSSKMKKMRKRILAMLLCTSMVLSSGVSASADEGMAAAQEQGHVHTEACYEKQNTGNLICTKAEVMEGHVHGDECYDTTPKLTCEQEEHSHDDGCYTTETKDVCNDESEEHTCGDACVETEEVLTCTAEEHSHNDGCYETETNLICGQEEVEAHIHNDECYAWEEKLVCTLSETAPMAEEAAAQETVTEQPKEDKEAEEAAEAEEVNLQNDDEAGIKVSVKSTSDVIPEDTKVVVAPMEMDEEHETALAEAVSEFEVLGYTAYDISLKDAEDEDITLGENKVEVVIDLEEVFPEGINAEEVKDVVLVHITTDEEDKLTAEAVGTVEITEEKATVEFEADSFSPYVVTYLGETEEAVEEVAVEEPVVEDVVLTYTSEDEAYTVTVTGTPEVLENVTAFEAVPVTDEEKITALTEQLTAKAAEAQKTSLGFENYEIKFLDAEGNEVTVNGEVKVSLSFAEERIPEAATAENVDAVDAALLKTGTNDKGEAVLEEINGLISAEAGAVKEVVYTTEAPEELILAWNGDVYRTLPNYEDDEVVITLAGTEYALQNVVGFNVTPIKEDNEETKEQYAEVAQQLDEKIAEENEAKEEEKEVVGFLAYDITLVDAEGNELEPQGGVKVSMEYKEAAAPEAVAEVEEAEVTIHHLAEDEKGEVKEVVDMVAEETIEAEVTTTEKAEVEKAEFVTDSFSTYTITWTVEGEDEIITAQVVNERLESIAGTNDINITKTLDGEYTFEKECKNLKVNGKTYVLKETIYKVNNNEPVEIDKVRYDKGNFQYGTITTDWMGREKTDWKKFETPYSLYLVYVEAIPIATVNSNEDNINIDVFDYSNWKNDDDKVLYWNNQNHSFDFVNSGNNNVGTLNNWTGENGGPRQGIVNNKLTLEGDLTLSGNHGGTQGESLKELFDKDSSKKYDANYLFVKENGYYVYDSRSHYAELDTTTSNFTVYNYPSNVEKGFFPFNEIGTAINESGSNTSATNHHYGMHIDFSFMQPKSGLPDGDPENPMIFEFSGDDDVWVFIEGMLVLDLGGIHTRTGGKIDFATGIVDYDINNPDGYSGSVKDSSIYKMFEAAGCSSEQLDSYFVLDELTGNYRFRDYSQHKLDFFYLERGADKSNCMIKFNLISVPEGPIWVEKEITQSNMADFADAVFEFKIETDIDPTTNKHSEGKHPLAGKSYKLYEVNGSEKTLIKEGLTTDQEGKFELKHRQLAEFTGIPVTTKYWVTELGVESDKYERVQFNETTIKNEKGEEFGDGNFSTGELEAQQCMYVKFQNQCNVANYRNLVINKVMADKTEGEEFAVRVQFADGVDKNGETIWVAYEGKYYLGSSTGDEETAKDGIIKLVAGGDAAYIVGLISDTKYRVYEELDSDQQLEYAVPIYTGNGDVKIKEDITYITGNGKVKTKEDVTYITDTIGLEGEENYTATVTNSLLKKVNVNKVWGDNGYSETTRPAAIQFKLQYSDGTNDPTDVLVKSASAEVELIPLNITLSESTSTAETKTVKIAEQEMTINLKYTSWGVEISGLSGNYIYSALEENVVGYKASYSSDDNGNITITNTLDWYIVKQSAGVDETTNTHKPLPGAEFKLTSEDGKTKYYGTSDANGVVKWYSVKQNQDEAALISKIPDGQYTLEETKAPSDYMRSETEYEVVVENGFPTVTVDLNPYENVELVQTKATDGTVKTQWINIYLYNACIYELPSTGGHGIYTTMLSGFALMLGAAYVWFKSRREESSNN